MRIDIDSVLRERLPRHYRYIPKWLIHKLESVICQDELNHLLTHNGHLTGAPFARGVIEDLGVTYELRGSLPEPAHTRVILTSNHPLGGLDGLVLATATAELYPTQTPRFIVNDILEAVEPLRPIFLGVNKHGSQDRSKAQRIDEAFSSADPIVMFPAGLVSRRGPSGTIADLEWHKMAVVKAISSGRDIIPVHFSGQNSEFFYKFASLRQRLGLRFNVEMIRLPREVILSRGSHYVITFGEPVPCSTLRGGREATAQAAELREMVYRLAGH